MRWNLRIATAVMVASSVGAVGVPGAAQAARTLAVTPATDLLDGDVVALHGTGFTPSATVYFCQAVVDGTPGPEDCGVPFQTAQADEAGEFVATYTVRRFMSPSSVGVDDRLCSTVGRLRHRRLRLLRVVARRRGRAAHLHAAAPADLHRDTVHRPG